MANIVATMTRILSDDKATISTMRLDKFQCFMLEDPWQRVKIPGKTRIPPGYYEIERIIDSPMAQRYRDAYGFGWIPGIKDVPGFTHIRMHGGNTPEHTDGCPLFATGISTDPIRGTESIKAMKLWCAHADNFNRLYLDVIDADR